MRGNDRDAVLASLNSLPGDLNGDGQVAFTDFLDLANNFGATEANYTQGDIDLDGTVAFLDFLAFANNFGKSASAAAAAVPEPSSLLLGAFALLGALRLRDRHSF